MTKEIRFGVASWGNQLVRNFKQFIQACKALKKLICSFFSKEFVQSSVQFNDQFSDLSARLHAIFSEEDADGASIDIVLTSFNQPFVFHAFEGARQTCGFHAHARSKLGARRAFSFNAQQRVAHAHADAVGFRQAGVQSSELAPPQRS